ncbi:MAG: M20 family metallo-hydrolase, partial [Smithellaceae bacterium]|nr:M20 family metallo-hydrolase [Smithellaceae bacterium]
WLKEKGVPVKQIDAPDARVSSASRPNVIVRVPGRTQGSTWILTHLDIVPPGELKFWNGDPYRRYVKDGRIYGRGVEDNQQDMVASIFAARAFLEERIEPERSIGLVFVADEETASTYGLPYLLKHPDNPFRRDDIIVVPDSGNADGAAIEIAEKSILWLRFKTIGKQCHGSRPELGRNAFLAASQLVIDLQGLHKLFPATDPLYQPPASTFQPTKKEANVPNVNTIPGEDVFYMDCRVLPQYPLSDVWSRIRSMAKTIEDRFGVTIEISSTQEIQAPPPTSSDAPVVLSLQKAIADVYGVEAVPIGVGAGTVAAFFRQEDYPVAVWSKITQTAHQPNENCLIANMIGNAKVFARLFLSP